MPSLFVFPPVYDPPVCNKKNNYSSCRNCEAFWAPVNAGATEIPTTVPQAKSEVGGTNEITKSCGQLFQWGRKYGFEETYFACCGLP